MTAFDPGGRRIRLHGTEGTIESAFNDNWVEVFRAIDKTRQRFAIAPQTGEHAGGDAAVISSLVRAIRCNDPNMVLTSTAQSLETHAIVFAAEKARREGRVVDCVIP